mmetsp:Transcript_26203/g.84615  ORF Transcript_26203/g.84615 Transcript_26203/m.84615 type:complete len:278 (+) Transcript_26203:635-1468(+)
MRDVDAQRVQHAPEALHPGATVLLVAAPLARLPVARRRRDHHRQVSPIEGPFDGRCLCKRQRGARLALARALALCLRLLLAAVWRAGSRCLLLLPIELLRNGLGLLRLRRVFRDRGAALVAGRRLSLPGSLSPRPCGVSIRGRRRRTKVGHWVHHVVGRNHPPPLKLVDVDGEDIRGALTLLHDGAIQGAREARPEAPLPLERLLRRGGQLGEAVLLVVQAPALGAAAVQQQRRQSDAAKQVGELESGLPWRGWRRHQRVVGRRRRRRRVGGHPRVG